jgi:hypothetical protein
MPAAMLLITIFLPKLNVEVQAALVLDYMRAFEPNSRLRDSALLE